MTDDQAKAEVARLLLKRAEMRRLGLELPPQDLMLLKRLMYRLGMNNVKLQRRESLLRLARRLGVRRYAKLDSRHEAHPLVQGFPIENALRHLANDPNNHPNIRELAKVAVTGGKNGDGSNIPTALWALHDELYEHNHPAKDWYNWMSAADKIGLDAHVARAVDELHHGYRSRHTGNPDDLPWDHTPGGIINRAVSGTATKPAFVGDDIRGHQAIRQRIHDRVSQLDSRWTPDMIDESLLRHRMRSSTQWLRDQGVMSHDDEQEFRNRDTQSVYSVKGNEKLSKQVKATRYSRILRRLARRAGVEPSSTEGLRRYQMVAGDFLGALRRIRSSDQHAIRKTTEEIAAKLGLKPASTVDALHNSPAYSVPGVAQAIYANAPPESIHAAAAWYGLTGNIPGMAVFHVRPDGPDMLHRFRMQGSGHDMLAKLDKAGITDRVLVPHRKGFDLLIPDRGGRMRDRVQGFTQRQKTELQSSRGHFKLIGAADQAKAREMFRNTITKHENATPQPERPTMRSRLRSMLVRMARHLATDNIRQLMIALGQNPADATIRYALAEEMQEAGHHQAAELVKSVRPTVNGIPRNRELMGSGPHDHVFKDTDTHRMLYVHVPELGRLPLLRWSVRKDGNMNIPRRPRNPNHQQQPQLRGVEGSIEIGNADNRRDNAVIGPDTGGQ